MMVARSSRRMAAKYQDITRMRRRAVTFWEPRQLSMGVHAVFVRVNAIKARTEGHQ